MFGGQDGKLWVKMSQNEVKENHVLVNEALASWLEFEEV